MNLDIFRDDDLILTSDSDEIPNPEVLKYASEWLNDDIKIEDFETYVDQLINERHFRLNLIAKNYDFTQEPQ